MAFKKEQKDFKSSRSEWLKRKWGMENTGTNEAFESSRKDLLDVLLPVWEDLKGEQRAYFDSVLAHQEKWKKIWAEQY